MFSDQGGYYIFPNGLILQWGQNVAFSDGFGRRIKTILFNKAFPHKALSINTTIAGRDCNTFDFINPHSNTPNDYDSSAVIARYSNDSFDIVFDTPWASSSDIVPFFWMAIGY